MVGGTNPSTSQLNAFHKFCQGPCTCYIVIVETEEEEKKEGEKKEERGRRWRNREHRQHIPPGGRGESPSLNKDSEGSLQSTPDS